MAGASVARDALEVFSGNASPELAAAICKGLGVSLGSADVRRFSDGEIFGYLWIATAGGGICSFDGINFVQYEERNGLAGQIVNCITGDNQGNIWVGTTWGGISKYDGKKLYNYTRETHGLKSNSINCLMFDKKTTSMLVGTMGGVEFIKDNRAENNFCRQRLNTRSFFSYHQQK